MIIDNQHFRLVGIFLVKGGGCEFDINFFTGVGLSLRACFLAQ